MVLSYDDVVRKYQLNYFYISNNYDNHSSD